MKKHLLCLILISLISSIIPIYGAQPLTVTIDGIQYRIKDAKAAVVESVTDRTISNLVFPDAITYQGKEYPVTQILGGCTSNENLVSITIGDNVTLLNNGCFSNCDNLTTINFGKSVEIIGAWVFSDCDGLKNLTIPPTVKQFWSYAFRGCKNLSTIILPKSLELISLECFKDCTSLTSINIPESVREIDQSAFENCTSLASVTLSYSSDAKLGKDIFKSCTALSTVNISDCVTNLGERAFSDCSSLKSINIPGSLAKAGPYVFWNCTNLTSVKFGYGATCVPAYMFQNCTNLTEVEIPSTLTEIHGSAFSGCCNLKSFDFKNLESIGGWAFSGCPLTTLNFSNKLTRIDRGAFRYCGNIVEVYIPLSVNYLNYFAFADCEKLETVYIYRPSPPRGEQFLYVDVFYNSYPENMTLHVPVGCKERYASIQEWNFGTIIDDLENTTSITDIESGESAAIDYAEPFEVYNTQGQLVGDSLGELSKGLYIIRQGNKTEKKLVK